MPLTAVLDPMASRKIRFDEDGFCSETDDHLLLPFELSDDFRGQEKACLDGEAQLPRSRKADDRLSLQGRMHGERTGRHAVHQDAAG